MAGLSSSTVQRGGSRPRQQASSDEMAEILRSWDDEDDEMVEYMQNSRVGGQNLLGNGSDSAAVARYSPSSVRFAKTMCLFVCFFGLGACVAILGPTLLELACQTHTVQVEHMSYAFTSRSFGYLLGSIIGGWLFDKYNGHVVLSVSCMWGTLMMLVLPFVKSIYGLIIVTGLLGLGLGSVDTGGNVLLLNTWGKKSRPYMQALHFLFALGAFVAPLIAQPFLQEGSVPSNSTFCPQSNVTNVTSNGSEHGPNYTGSNNTSGNIMPAYWISSIPLAVTAMGFLVFVFIKACSLRDGETQKEEAPKAKQGSLMYRIVILSLFSVFLLLYVGLEVAYGGYIFTYGRTIRDEMSTDNAAFLTSAFWGSFALARLAAVPISRYLRPSKMLWMDMAGCLLGSIVLVSQFKGGDCCASDMRKLWVGTVLLGVSMASVFPSAVNWAEYFVTVSGRTASVLVVASSCGEMLIPLAVGNTIDKAVGPCSLMACAFVVSVLVLITFLLILASGRYFKRNSAFAGMLYQRSQKQEERLRQRPPDEVLDLLEQNNELFNNGDHEITM